MATKAEIAGLIQELTEGSKKNPDGTAAAVIGYLRIPVSWVREQHFQAHYDGVSGVLVHDEDAKKTKASMMTHRCHAVYATGIERRPSHAEIFGCNFQHISSRSKRTRQGKNLGDRVVERFTPVHSTDEIVELGV
jgi:hypothetical protein